jgi:DNA-binding CsgD family transcriptional regulator
MAHALHDLELEVVEGEAVVGSVPAIVEVPLLTLAEQQTLQALADYGSISAVCEHLHVARSTAKTHLRDLRRKLKVRRSPQLVAVGLRLRLIH